MFTPFRNNYGFGWRIGERFGRREMDHSGSDNGFSTYIIRFPNDGLTAMVLSNSDRASASRVGNTQSVFVQRQCDLAIGEHETGITCRGQSAEVVEGGDER